MADTFTPESPFLTTLADNDGHTWQFAYWGSRYVYIREVIEDDVTMPVMGDRASRDDWPYLIDLYNFSRRPEITRRWLADRSADWVIARNDDIRKGNV